MDSKWEEERWRKDWERESTEEEENRWEDGLKVDSKKKSDDQGNVTNKKKRKVECEEGRVWGESVGFEEKGIQEFLKSGREEGGPCKQRPLGVLTGVEWLAYQVVRDMISEAAEIGEAMEGMSKVEEWEEMTELSLWKALDNLDNTEDVEVRTNTKSSCTRTKKEEVHSSEPKVVKKRGKPPIQRDPRQKTLDSFITKSKVKKTLNRSNDDLECEVWWGDVKSESELEKEQNEVWSRALSAYSRGDVSRALEQLTEENIMNVSLAEHSGVSASEVEDQKLNNNCGGTIPRLQLTKSDKGGEGTEVIRNEGSEQKSLGRMIPILDQNFTPSWGGGVSARCNSESSRFSSPISKEQFKKEHSCQAKSTIWRRKF